MILSLTRPVDGIQQDLNLVGNQYNICLLIFFVGYVSLKLRIPKSYSSLISRYSSLIPPMLL
jgi:hypothetical protein